MNVNDLKDFKDFVHVLDIIKGYCEKIGNCELCPFYAKMKKYTAEKCCFFTFPHEGKIPEEWDTKTLLWGK